MSGHWRSRLRRTPPGRALSRWSSRILPYRKLRSSSEKLDAEYAAGKWEYLGGLEELARFSVVAGYCRFLKPGGAILELGCGEGLLLERLEERSFSRYVGVDVSAEAIRRAVNRSGGVGSFFSADAATYAPAGPFDLVVFNEVLEYFDDPLATVARYELALASDALLVVSMFDGLDTARARHIWKRLGKRYAVVDRTRVTSAAELSWTIKVLRPAHPIGG